MGIAIAPYTPDRILAVHAFNSRLAAAGVDKDFRLPVHAVPQLCFLALDGDTVRGGYTLREHHFMLHGAPRTISQYVLPLSEGIIDRAHVGVGVRLLRDAMAARPLLFALGMGGLHSPLPRMLLAAGWRLSVIRFCFNPCRPLAVMQGLSYGRVLSAARRLGGPLVTGLGGLALKAAAKLHTTTRTAADLSCTIVHEFGEWADVVWHACEAEYSMIAVRNREALNARYAGPDGPFIRVVVSRDGAVVGWAVLLDTRMRNHRQFGDLRVGSIVDGLAPTHEAATVVAMATRLLEDRGVDLIVSNQAHAAWTRALRASGFLPGPSNFVFAASPALTGRLEAFDRSMPTIHLNRGDGDGPIHL